MPNSVPPAPLKVGRRIEVEPGIPGPGVSGPGPGSGGTGGPTGSRGGGGDGGGGGESGGAAGGAGGGAIRDAGGGATRAAGDVPGFRKNDGRPAGSCPSIPHDYRRETQRESTFAAAARRRQAPAGSLAAKRSRWCSASPKVWAIMVSRRKVWLILSSSVMPMPPWSCTASWLTCRQASATLILAAETAWRRSAGGAPSTFTHARQAME